MKERGIGRLVGVGVGPGDPELLTIKGLSALKDADEVFVPVGDTGEVGRAEAVVRAHLGPDRAARLLFALSNDERARAENWERAANKVAAPLREKKTCAFATIGDPNLYSTFTYLTEALGKVMPEVDVETIPGITAMQDLASRSGTVLLLREERLALLPFTAGRDALRDALEGFETVVCYKGGGRIDEVLEVAEEAGRLEDGVYGSRLGMRGEEVVRAPEMLGREGNYLSAVIFTRGGAGRFY
ncbi:MAG TPA: precorrin-2 C(20)-methyltransferase [Rubrobacteraceae bacterium]|nr:precorrin-2 C(20)-methyltransferase [Rubrobacteraceae bacterium]